jgi:hypothetical protein
MTPEQRREQVIAGEMSALNLDKGAEQWQHTKEHPIEFAAQVALPAVIGAAAKYGGPILRGAATFAAKPSGGAVIGAVEEGIRTKGDPRSMAMGAVGGYTFNKVNDTSSKVSQLLQRVGLSKPPTAAGPGSLEHANGTIDRWMASYEAKQGAKAAGPTRANLENELAKRIDWRTTDAVPIDAMKLDPSTGTMVARQKGWIEPGESRIGLAERAAAHVKTGDAEEVEKLLRALRQRMRAGGEM